MRRRALFPSILIVGFGFLGAEPGVVTAQSQRGEVVVVAEIRGNSGPWTLCGVTAVVGEVHFEVLEVESGALESPEFVAQIPCPLGSYDAGRVLRVRLGPPRRALDGIVAKLPEQDGIPHFHLRSAVPAVGFKRFPPPLKGTSAAG